MMRTPRLAIRPLLALGITLVVGSPVSAGDEDVFVRDVVPFLSKHCYACHGNGKNKADLALDKFKDSQAVVADSETWETVLDMVRSGEMPPKERPRPAPDESEGALKA